MWNRVSSFFARAFSSSSKAGMQTEHFVLKGRRLREPFPEGLKTAAFGTGCFWGGERAFWSIPGVYSTAVGYTGGKVDNPTYEQVCSGRTGHNEVAQVRVQHHACRHLPPNAR